MSKALVYADVLLDGSKVGEIRRHGAAGIVFVAQPDAPKHIPKKIDGYVWAGLEAQISSFKGVVEKRVLN